MAEIVTGILSSTAGILWNKAIDWTAEKLKDGDVVDAEIRKLVVKELDDIKSRIDGFSRATLLASHDFLLEGVNLLNVSLDKISSGQKSSGASANLGGSSDEYGVLNRAFELSRAMGQLKLNGDREFETARERFKEARKTAVTAFWNEAFCIEDRILAAKLRIISEILEHLDSPETAITGCLPFLKTLHSLPAIQDMFLVYLDGGVKSFLKKTQREENVKSVMIINYVLFQYVWKFSNKRLFEVSACLPTIDLQSHRQFHPIIDWYEFFAKNQSLENELTRPPNELSFDERIATLSGVNSKGDVLTIPEPQSLENMVIVSETGKIKRVTLPVVIRGIHLASAVDINNNVYLVREVEGHSGKELILTILDENFHVKAGHTLDYLSTVMPISSCPIKIAICKQGDIIIILEKDPRVYVFDEVGQFKYKFIRKSSTSASLSISSQNEIMIPTDNRKAVEIYTKRGDLKATIKVPKGHKVLSAAFHCVFGKIKLLTWAREGKDSFFILCYSDDDGKLENLSFFGSKIKNQKPPRLTSHPKGPVAVVGEESITYI